MSNPKKAHLPSTNRFLAEKAPCVYILYPPIVQNLSPFDQNGAKYLVLLYQFFSAVFCFENPLHRNTFAFYFSFDNNYVEKK